MIIVLSIILMLSSTFSNEVYAWKGAGPALVFEDIGEGNPNAINLISTNFVRLIKAQSIPSNLEIPFYPENSTVDNVYVEMYIDIDDVINGFAKDIEFITQLYGRIIDLDNGPYNNKVYKVWYYADITDAIDDANGESLIITLVDDAYYNHEILGTFEDSEITNYIDLTNQYDIYEYKGSNQIYKNDSYLGILHVFMQTNYKDGCHFIYTENNIYTQGVFSGDYYEVTTSMECSEFKTIIGDISNKVERIDPITDEITYSIYSVNHTSWPSNTSHIVIMDYE